MKLLIILLGFTLIVSSCGNTNDKANYNQEIFEYYQKSNQTFTLSTSSGKNTISGKEGTKININRSDLVFKDGSEIKGEIEIQLTEYYDPSDIILANLSTSSNGQLIETGGMINISVFSKGKEIILKKGKTIEIEFASQKKERMEIFHGEFSIGKINWEPAIKPIRINNAGFLLAQQEFGDTEMEVIMIDSIASSEAVEESAIMNNNILKSTKFGWINCDRFLNLTNLTSLEVVYDTIYQPSAFLVFNNINSIMPCFYENSSRKFINLPIGQKATLIVFSIDGEQVHYNTKEIEIKKNGTTKIELKKVSLDELEHTLQVQLEL